MLLAFPASNEPGIVVAVIRWLMRTFDHSSISISPTVVSKITRPFVGKAMIAQVQPRFNNFTSLRDYVMVKFHHSRLYKSKRQGSGSLLISC